MKSVHQVVDLSLDLVLHASPSQPLLLFILAGRDSEKKVKEQTLGCGWLDRTRWVRGEVLVADVAGRSATSNARDITEVSQVIVREVL